MYPSWSMMSDSDDGTFPRWYRRGVGRPETSDEVRGYWLFALGAVLGVLGLALFLPSRVASPLREYAPEARVLDVGEAAFEIYEDRGGEYRWRLCHRNGNVLADSGQGYAERRNAREGVESVKQNAPNAELESADEADDAGDGEGSDDGDGAENAEGAGTDADADADTTGETEKETEDGSGG